VPHKPGQDCATRIHVRLLGPCFKTGRIETTTAVMRELPPDFPLPSESRVELFARLATTSSNSPSSLRPRIPITGNPRSRYMNRYRDSAKRIAIIPTIRTSRRLSILQPLTAPRQQCTPLGYSNSRRNPLTGVIYNNTAAPRLNSAATSQLHSFPCWPFHVLFNSLFKVLFNFPSRYLFAIGLTVVFSLTRSLPGTLTCTPKQVDSAMAGLVSPEQSLQGSHLLWRLTQENLCLHKGESKHPVINVAPLSPPSRKAFTLGFIPVHSPLLGESHLFSFPPLSDMLKLSGSSCLM
jgi:hypothetical protein